MSNPYVFAHFRKLFIITGKTLHVECAEEEYATYSGYGVFVHFHFRAKTMILNRKIKEIIYVC